VNPENQRSTIAGIGKYISNPYWGKLKEEWTRFTSQEDSHYIRRGKKRRIELTTRISKSTPYHQQYYPIVIVLQSLPDIAKGFLCPIFS
jgi:hypothetical protein